jgi:formylglycine-generating enzyme required for sulfatase activity
MASLAVYDSEGVEIRLGPQVGRGGESAVYRVVGQADRLVKVYTTPHIAVYERKLTWMLDHPPDDPMRHQGHDSFAWPLDVLTDERGVFVGYMMPFVQNAVTILRVFNPRLRAQTLPEFDGRYLHRTARNLAAALMALQARGYVIGDLHESNVMVTPSALVTLIDTDSFQVEVHDGEQSECYPCIVGKPEYTPPELQGKSFHEVRRLPEHDCFGLGVLIFQLLMEGNHPFRGRWLGQSDPPPLEEKIRLGLFPYDEGSLGLVAPPPTGLWLDTLHPQVASLMRRCFVDGHEQPNSRPTPKEWKRALAVAEEDLVGCGNGHYYASHLDGCPLCRVQVALRRRPAPVPLRPVLRPAAQRVVSLVPAASSVRRMRRFMGLGVLLAIGVYIGGWIMAGLLPVLLGLPAPTVAPVAPRAPTCTPPPPQLLPLPTDLPPSRLVTDARGVPMALVPAGSFEMGGENSGQDGWPIHTVTLDAFYIDQYEVTNARFATFLNEQSEDAEVVVALSLAACDWFHIERRDGAWQVDDGCADLAVVWATWDEARAYCEWRGARLPTEAEWEKAARGTDGREYPWGQGIDCTVANYGDCVGDVMPVGSYPKGISPYGAYDMAGNVWEWVNDWYQKDYYGSAPSNNPPGPSSGSDRVRRGGAWSNSPGYLRTMDRGSSPPAWRHSNLGFRCAVSVATAQFEHK